MPAGAVVAEPVGRQAEEPVLMLPALRREGHHLVGGWRGRAILVVVSGGLRFDGAAVRDDGEEGEEEEEEERGGG